MPIPCPSNGGPCHRHRGPSPPPPPQATARVSSSSPSSLRQASSLLSSSKSQQQQQQQQFKRSLSPSRSLPSFSSDETCDFLSKTKKPIRTTAAPTAKTKATTNSKSNNSSKGNIIKGNKKTSATNNNAANSNAAAGIAIATNTRLLLLPVTSRSKTPRTSNLSIDGGGSCVNDGDNDDDNGNEDHDDDVVIANSSNAAAAVSAAADPATGRIRTGYPAAARATAKTAAATSETTTAITAIAAAAATAAAAEDAARAIAGRRRRKKAWAEGRRRHRHLQLQAPTPPPILQSKPAFEVFVDREYENKKYNNSVGNCDDRYHQHKDDGSNSMKNKAKNAAAAAAALSGDCPPSPLHPSKASNAIETEGRPVDRNDNVHRNTNNRNNTTTTTNDCNSRRNRSSYGTTVANGGILTSILRNSNSHHKNITTRGRKPPPPEPTKTTKVATVGGADNNTDKGEPSTSSLLLCAHPQQQKHESRPSFSGERMDSSSGESMDLDSSSSSSSGSSLLSDNGGSAATNFTKTAMTATAAAATHRRQDSTRNNNIHCRHQGKQQQGKEEETPPPLQSQRQPRPQPQQQRHRRLVPLLSSKIHSKTNSQKERSSANGPVPAKITEGAVGTTTTTTNHPTTPLLLPLSPPPVAAAKTGCTKAAAAAPLLPPPALIMQRRGRRVGGNRDDGGDWWRQKRQQLRQTPPDNAKALHAMLTTPEPPKTSKNTILNNKKSATAEYYPYNNNKYVVECHSFDDVSVLTNPPSILDNNNDERQTSDNKVVVAKKPNASTTTSVPATPKATAAASTIAKRDRLMQIHKELPQSSSQTKPHPSESRVISRRSTRNPKTEPSPSESRAIPRCSTRNRTTTDQPTGGLSKVLKGQGPNRQKQLSKCADSVPPPPPSSKKSCGSNGKRATGTLGRTSCGSDDKTTTAQNNAVSVSHPTPRFLKANDASPATTKPKENARLRTKTTDVLTAPDLKSREKMTPVGGDIVDSRISASKISPAQYNTVSVTRPTPRFDKANTSATTPTVGSGLDSFYETPQCHTYARQYQRQRPAGKSGTVAATPFDASSASHKCWSSSLDQRPYRAINSALTATPTASEAVSYRRNLDEECYPDTDTTGQGGNEETPFKDPASAASSSVAQSPFSLDGDGYEHSADGLSLASSRSFTSSSNDSRTDAAPLPREITRHNTTGRSNVAVGEPRRRRHQMGHEASDEETTIVYMWTAEDAGFVNQSILFSLPSGKTYRHPPLPPGWSLKVSRSMNRPYYFHPTFGRTMFPPVQLPSKGRPQRQRRQQRLRQQQGASTSLASGVSGLPQKCSATVASSSQNFAKDSTATSVIKSPSSHLSSPSFQKAPPIEYTATVNKEAGEKWSSSDTGLITQHSQEMMMIQRNLHGPVSRLALPSQLSAKDRGCHVEGRDKEGKEYTVSKTSQEPNSTLTVDETDTEQIVLECHRQAEGIHSPYHPASSSVSMEPVCSEANSGTIDEVGERVIGSILSTENTNSGPPASRAEATIDDLNEASSTSKILLMSSPSPETTRTIDSGIEEEFKGFDNADDRFGYGNEEEGMGENDQGELLSTDSVLRTDESTPLCASPRSLSARDLHLGQLEETSFANNEVVELPQHCKEGNFDDGANLNSAGKRNYSKSATITVDQGLEGDNSGGSLTGGDSSSSANEKSYDDGVPIWAGFCGKADKRVYAQKNHSGSATRRRQSLKRAAKSGRPIWKDPLCCLQNLEALILTKARSYRGTGPKFSRKKAIRGRLRKRTSTTRMPKKS